MVASGQVVLTIIPDEIIAIKKKYFEMWTERWIWDNMLADIVFVFSGNAAVCGNSKYTIDNFTSWDYIGTGFSIRQHINFYCR